MSTHAKYASPLIQRAEDPATLRPLGIVGSLVLFGLPAAILFVAFHALRPRLESFGYDSFTSFLATLGVPLVLLFIAALVAYYREGQPLTWQAFAERLRFPRLQWRDVLWGLAIFMVGGLGMGLLSGLILSLIQQGWISIPSHLPALADPQVTVTRDVLAQSAGGIIHARLDLAILYLVVFFFNIAGEELWWRGYILPRQELAFGRHTWLVHGVLWACFHAFKWWDILPLLPMCLLTAFCAQRTRSTWGGLIGHALSNGMSLIGVLWFIVS